MIGDWTDLAAEEITVGYRRFLYLKALTGETLTPPKCIDEAWHLHMTFPANYYALQKAMGRNIEHSQRLTWKERRLAWEKGRSLWKAEFDGDPGLTIWPPIPTRLRLVTGIAIWAVGIGLAALASKAGWTLQTSRGFDAVVPAIVFFFGLLGLVAGFGMPEPKTISRCG